MLKAMSIHINLNLNEQIIPFDVPSTILFDLLAKSRHYTPPEKSVMLYVDLNPAIKLF